jgi:hypothetical protein
VHILTITVDFSLYSSTCYTAWNHDGDTKYCHTQILPRFTASSLLAYSHITKAKQENYIYICGTTAITVLTSPTILICTRSSTGHTMESRLWILVDAWIVIHVFLFYRVVITSGHHIKVVLPRVQCLRLILDFKIPEWHCDEVFTCQQPSRYRLQLQRFIDCQQQDVFLLWVNGSPGSYVDMRFKRRSDEVFVASWSVVKPLTACTIYFGLQGYAFVYW